MNKKNLNLSLIFIFVCNLLIFLFIAKNYNGQQISRFDKTIIEFVESYHNDKLTNFLTLYTKIGDEVTVVVLTIVAVIIIFLIGYRKYSYFFTGVMVLGGVILIKGVKKIVARPRPNINRLIEETGFSLPSGHAMASVLFYITLLMLILAVINSSYKYIIALILIIHIIGIGLSRVYLGVHYPSDIIAGYTLGGATILLCYLFSFKFNIFERKQKNNF